MNAKYRKIICSFICVICLLAFCTTSLAAPQGEVTVMKCVQIAHTRPEIIFSVANSPKKFILLDDTEDGFLVLAYDQYGAARFDPDGTEKFDIDDKNNIAGWLNGEFLEKGNYYNRRTYKLPDAIIRNLVEHDWVTEAGGPHTDFQEDYVTRCAIAVPSKTEVLKYYGIFGYADDTTVSNMLLRTTNGTVAQTGGSTLNLIVKHVTKTGMIRTATASNRYGLRPIFYLNKDFFIRERINISSAGDEIRKLIKTNYTEAQLAKIYSRKEISKLTAALPPQAKNVRVTGTPVVGSTLKCTYDYYAPDGQKESGTQITWIRYNKEGTKAHIIPGATGSEYVATKEDIGRGISARVTPRCEGKAGRVTEAVFYRNDVLEIVDDTVSYIENLKIAGNLTKGGNAFADYEYYNPVYSIENGTIYEWQGSYDGKAFDSITAFTERGITIPEDFKYNYLRCLVTLSTGATYTAPVAELKEDAGAKEAFSSADAGDYRVSGGEALVLEGDLFKSAHCVTFTVDKPCIVTAEGCDIISAPAGDKTNYAIIPNNSENIRIYIKSDTDAVISNVAVSRKL